MLSEQPLSSLRRASRVQLNLLSFDDTLLARGEPVRTAGRAIADDVLDYAAPATQGYPFLVQLIGDLAWKADPQNTMGDARRAFQRARRTMGSHTHNPPSATYRQQTGPSSPRWPATTDHHGYPTSGPDSA